MGKIDEVSENIGEIKGTLKGIAVTLENMEDHLKTLNGSVKRNSERAVKNSESIKWLTTKNTIYGGGAGGVITMLVLIIKHLLGA